MKKKEVWKNSNNNFFITPKWKKAFLEMALKSFNISKLDHQMSKRWKQIAAHAFETITKFDRMKNWVPDCWAQDRISAKTIKCTGFSMIGNTFLIFFFKFLLRPSVLGAGHGQNYKASNMKRNHYCVWKLYSIMLNRKSTWNVTFLKCLVPSTYLHFFRTLFTHETLTNKMWLQSCAK